MPAPACSFRFDRTGCVTDCPSERPLRLSVFLPPSHGNKRDFKRKQFTHGLEFSAGSSPPASNLRPTLRRSLPNESWSEVRKAANRIQVKSQILPGIGRIYPGRKFAPSMTTAGQDAGECIRQRPSDSASRSGRRSQSTTLRSICHSFRLLLEEVARKRLRFGQQPS